MVSIFSDIYYLGEGLSGEGALATNMTRLKDNGSGLQHCVQMVDFLGSSINIIDLAELQVGVISVMRFSLCHKNDVLGIKYLKPIVCKKHFRKCSLILKIELGVFAARKMLK